MKGIRRNECGLLNWSTDEACKRCHAALASNPPEVEDARLPHDDATETVVASESQRVSFVAPPPPARSHRKAILVVAALFLLLVSVSVPATFWALKSSPPDYEKLIPNSSQYRRTLNILINREFASSTDFLDVDFNWRWKANEFGRALDISQPSYKGPEDIIGKYNWLPADSQDMPVRDSRATYEGFARLRKKDDGSWQVTTIWFAKFS